MSRRALLPLFVLSISFPAAAQTDAPAPPPGEMSAREFADRMAEAVRTIRDSTSPDDAVRAYRAACDLDARNVELLDTYMRKMLKFGLLHLAYDPAAKLADLQPGNVVALSTAGHQRAVAAEMPAALNLFIKAYKLAPGDPSIETNLGQLMAWAEMDEDAKAVPVEQKKFLMELKDTPRWKQALGKLHAAYMEGRKVYERRQEIWHQNLKAVKEAEFEVKRAQDRLDGADKAVRQQADKASPFADQIAQLRKELASIQAEGRQANASLEPYRDSMYADPRDRARYRRDVDRRNAKVRERIRDLEKRYKQVSQQLADLEAKAGREDKGLTEAKAARLEAWEDLRKKQAALQALRNSVEDQMAQVGAGWKWAPPTLDGVVVSVIAVPPGSVLIAPPGHEIEAARELRRAEVYINARLYDKARQILKLIAELYPATEAGRDARRILETLPSGSPGTAEK